jgi:hypothetical protein
VVKEGFKLDAEQTAFSTHASLALDAVVKVSFCLFSCDDDGAVSVLKAEMRFVIAEISIITFVFENYTKV